MSHSVGRVSRLRAALEKNDTYADELAEVVEADE